MRFNRINIKGFSDENVISVQSKLLFRFPRHRRDFRVEYKHESTYLQSFHLLWSKRDFTGRHQSMHNSLILHPVLTPSYISFKVRCGLIARRSEPDDTWIRRLTLHTSCDNAFVMGWKTSLKLWNFLSCRVSSPSTCVLRDFNLKCVTSQERKMDCKAKCIFLIPPFLYHRIRIVRLMTLQINIPLTAESKFVILCCRCFPLHPRQETDSA